MCKDVIINPATTPKNKTKKQNQKTKPKEKQ